MPIFKEISGKKPAIHSSCFVAEDAVVAGDVEIGEDSSLWYSVVIRGDVNKIRIGRKSNIQDHSMIHGSVGKNDTIIGDNVTIGHRAIIHGCKLSDNVLIGMGAIVLDNAIIEEYVIVGAGSVVLEGSVLESGHLYAGVPAKKIKALDKATVANHLKASAEGYVYCASLYK